ncbi:hypothetical protein ACFFHI_02925 [Streptomyces palmae]
MRHGQTGLVWAGRILLLTALVLGIVTMHTLGHLTQHDSGHEPARIGMTAPQPHQPMPPGRHTPMADEEHPGRHTAPDLAPTPAPGHPAAAAVEAAHTSTAHPAMPGDHGFSPMDVCLAVLGAWTVVLLVAAGLSWRARDILAAARAGLLRVLAPIPPPGQRLLLARLSVLRI